MLLAPTVHPDKQDAVPAITHVDGTARVQTCDEISNPLGAVVAYAGALVLMRRALPEGSSRRLGDMARAFVLLLPALAWVLLLDRWIPAHLGLPLRLAALLPGLVAVFALGLVTRHDLEKLALLPLPTAWQRRSRDAIVGRLDRLAQAFETRGTA